MKYYLYHIEYNLKIGVFIPGYHEPEDVFEDNSDFLIFNNDKNGVWEAIGNKGWPLNIIQANFFDINLF